MELVGIHSHIGSNIHDADAFIQAAKRMMLLRKTFYAADAYTLPEVDLGGGYSVAYTDGEDSMDVRVELRRLAEAVGAINRALGVRAGHQLRARTMDRRPGRRDPVSCGHDQAVHVRRQDRPATHR